MNCLSCQEDPSVFPEPQHYKGGKPIPAEQKKAIPAEQKKALPTQGAQGQSAEVTVLPSPSQTEVLFVVLRGRIRVFCKRFGPGRGDPQSCRVVSCRVVSSQGHRRSSALSLQPWEKVVTDSLQTGVCPATSCLTPDDLLHLSFPFQVCFPITVQSQRFTVTVRDLAGVQTEGVVLVKVTEHMIPSRVPPLCVNCFCARPCPVRMCLPHTTRCGSSIPGFGPHLRVSGRSDRERRP